MLKRCERCTSKYAYDLLCCPQCGAEAEGNSTPDPDVVGGEAVTTMHPTELYAPVELPADAMEKLADPTPLTGPVLEPPPPVPVPVETDANTPTEHDPEPAPAGFEPPAA